MKISNLFKISSQKVAVGKKRPFLKRIGRDVYVDWGLSVFVVVIITLLLVFLGYRESELFYKNLNGEAKVAVPKDSSNIDTKALDSVLDRYQEKKLRNEDLFRSYVGPQDPAI